MFRSSIIVSLYLLVISMVLPGVEKGLYKTAEDFTHNRLTHAGKKTRIKLHEVTKQELVEVRYGDSTYTYLKKEVFGYKDGDGKCYRFFDNKIYHILNPLENILLYKVSKFEFAGQSQNLDVYLYSKNADCPVRELTMRHLLSDFTDNKAFCKLLEIHFNGDVSLHEYDKVHKMYKLNRVLELSKNE